MGPEDANLRAQAMTELASGAVRALDLSGLGRAVALIPPRSGITARSAAGAILLDLSPPLASATVAKLLGWSGDPFARDDARPRLGPWALVVPEGARTAHGIAQLRLERAEPEATQYVSGADPWRVARPNASHGVVEGIVTKLLGSTEAPKTVAALEAALGVTLDRAALAASSMGRLKLAPSGSVILDVSARYTWFPEREVAVTDAAELRARGLSEWSVTFAEGLVAIDTALRARFGEPSMRQGHRVFTHWVLDGSEGRPCTLAWYARPPEWTTAPLPAIPLGRAG
ncbi:MAG: hypothetical protein JST00_45505 [Deltaproteobacteria bacterium]|nr:hypothetical protein [Deltaproteobacteria bacterium]